MHPMLNIAVRAARSAGNVIARSFEQSDKIEVEAKGLNDLVTNVDKQAEQIIIDTILKSYPEHSIVSEERGVIAGSNADYQWIIDPLDGTTNFIKGIPHFAVSIALKYKGKLDQAVIYDPIRGELFTASRGKGAQLNNSRIRVSNMKEINGSVLATGFPFKQKASADAYLNMFKDLFTKTADMRRAGSAALDLAYVAAGRVDGFFELGLKPWDTAAGELLVIEAGGLVTDFNGGTNHAKSGNTVAANARVLKQLLTDIRPHLTPSMINR
ncbi:inositol-1-monophosphatase [Thalassotalea ponticola]|uniref:inositol-1-monophosphatase n=1 Tax=Thalassotalea ponticola TaxID=1523392 RepID=UPI0025B38608|nr:inositol-1-monophosphatase [Thalassotalea ponticola]MDN3653872.1 inositol-1-monophosphatase [Thalassotalea ponticola]